MEATSAPRPDHASPCHVSPSQQGKTVVAITSGANINFERLRLVSELANVGALTEATLTTTLPEQPGAFKTFVDTVVSTTGSSSSSTSSDSKDGRSSIQVTEFKYR